MLARKLEYTKPEKNSKDDKPTRMLIDTIYIIVYRKIRRASKKRNIKKIYVKSKPHF